MEQKISKAEIRYGDTNQGFVTMRAMRNEAGGMDITIIDAFFRTDSGEEVVAIIADFKRRLSERMEGPEQVPKQVAVPKPKKVQSEKRKRHLWTDEEKAEAMKMYAEGEDLDKIASTFASTNASVMKIMQRHNVRRPWPTKGRPSQLEAVKEEPQPEAEENEPV